MWLNLLFFILFCTVLFGSGALLVKSLAKIAYFLHITEYTAAFIIMAIATSFPELFVGITSAISKNPALSFGNIIGANILDLTLVTGIIILAGRGIKIRSKKTKKDSLFMLLPVILPLILFLIGNSLSRIDGVILLLTFLGYSFYSVKRRKEFQKPLKDKVKRLEVVFQSAFFIVFLVIMFFSANYVVHYASLLSIDLALPPIMIGIFLISIGTVLPELTFGVAAALNKKGDMVLGDQIGTVVTNSTLILGITALIYPITANFALFIISAAFLVVSAFLFATFFQTGSKLYVIEAITLILLYALFIFIEFYIKGLII